MWPLKTNYRLMKIQFSEHTISKNLRLKRVDTTAFLMVDLNA